MRFEHSIFIDESQNYGTQCHLMLSKLKTSMGALNQSVMDTDNGKISVIQFKENLSNFIKDINGCYDIYLSLKPPEIFKTVHELLGIAMEHFINSNTYLQQYIDAENIADMSDCMKKAASEAIMGDRYLKKAIEKVNGLK